MKLAYLFIFIYLTLLIPQEPIGLLAKIIGKAKFENNNKTDINKGMSINLDDHISTSKKSFAKIIFLDDGSTISLYSKSSVIFGGSIENYNINKQLEFLSGIVKLDINSDFSRAIKVLTKSSELECNACNIWILSNETGGEQFILNNGVARLYNLSIDRSIKLNPDSLIISNEELGFQSSIIPITTTKYLESKMLDFGEKNIEFNKVEVSKSDNIQESGSIVIKLKNAINEQKEIILIYGRNSLIE